MQIFYLGPDGSYSSIVAHELFSKGKDSFVPCASFLEIFTAILENSDSAGIVPIENSTTSNVHENIDLIFNRNIQIMGEAFLEINVSLIALKGTGKGDIKTVCSHAKVFEQCSDFILKHQLKTLAVNSSALAFKTIIDTDDKSLAALGSKKIAFPSELSVLDENVANQIKNITRFVVVKAPENTLTEKRPGKVTAIFKAKHEPGSLAKVLTVLGEQRVNLSKIESRPIPGSNWEYNFWIDIEIKPGEFNTLKKNLSENTLEHRIVGAYHKGKTYQS